MTGPPRRTPPDEDARPAPPTADRPFARGVAHAPVAFPPSGPGFLPRPREDGDTTVPHGLACTLREFLDVYRSPANVEWVDGFTRYKPAVTNRRQDVCSFLYRVPERRREHEGCPAKARFNGQDLLVPRPDGAVVRLRRPDAVVMLDREDPRIVPDGWAGADLCVEVISPDDPRRDTVRKRAEYAAAGVRE